MIHSTPPKFSGHFIFESNTSLDSLEAAWGQRAADDVFQLAHYVTARLSPDICVRYRHSLYKGEAGELSNKYDSVTISKRGSRQPAVAMQNFIVTDYEGYNLKDAGKMLLERQSHRQFAEAVMAAATALDDGETAVVPNRFQGYFTSMDTGIPEVPQE